MDIFCNNMLGKVYIVNFLFPIRKILFYEKEEDGKRKHQLRRGFCFKCIAGSQRMPASAGVCVGTSVSSPSRG